MKIVRGGGSEEEDYNIKQKYYNNGIWEYPETFERKNRGNTFKYRESSSIIESIEKRKIIILDLFQNLEDTVLERKRKKDHGNKKEKYHEIRKNTYSITVKSQKTLEKKKKSIMSNAKL